MGKMFSALKQSQVTLRHINGCAAMMLHSSWIPRLPQTWILRLAAGLDEHFQLKEHLSSADGLWYGSQFCFTPGWHWQEPNHAANLSSGLFPLQGAPQRTDLRVYFGITFFFVLTLDVLPRTTHEPSCPWDRYKVDAQWAPPGGCICDVTWWGRLNPGPLAFRQKLSHSAAVTMLCCQVAHDELKLAFLKGKTCTSQQNIAVKEATQNSNINWVVFNLRLGLWKGPALKVTAAGDQKWYWKQQFSITEFRTSLF